MGMVGPVFFTHFKNFLKLLIRPPYCAGDTLFLSTILLKSWNRFSQTRGLHLWAALSNVE